MYALGRKYSKYSDVGALGHIAGNYLVAINVAKGSDAEVLH